MNTDLFAFRAGPHPGNEVVTTPSIEGIEGIEGIEKTNATCPADSSHAPQYLVWSQSTRINYRSFKMRNGQTKYAAEPTNNPNAILLRPGGLHDPQTLIAGEMSITSDSKAAKELFTAIKKVITTRFKKINSYYLGAEAMEILANGGRLTSNAKAPQEYDLSRPS
jgi:hypothetical protein